MSEQMRRGTLPVMDHEWHPSTDAELDAAAEISEADIADAIQSARERVPELARFLDAALDTSGDLPADHPAVKRQRGERRVRKHEKLGPVRPS
jgi:hypothetical protein